MIDNDSHFPEWLSFYKAAGAAKFYVFAGMCSYIASRLATLNRSSAHTLMISRSTMHTFSDLDTLDDDTCRILKRNEGEVRILPMSHLNTSFGPGAYCLRHNPDRAARLLVVGPRDYVFPVPSDEVDSLRLSEQYKAVEACHAKSQIQIPLYNFGTSGQMVRQSGLDLIQTFFRPGFSPQLERRAFSAPSSALADFGIYPRTCKQNCLDLPAQLQPKDKLVLATYTQRAQTPSGRHAMLVEAISCRVDSEDCLREAHSLSENQCAKAFQGNTYMAYSVEEVLLEGLERLGSEDRAWASAVSIARGVFRRRPTLDASAALRRIKDVVQSTLPPSVVASGLAAIRAAIQAGQDASQVEDHLLLRFAEDVEDVHFGDSTAGRSAQKAAAVLALSDEADEVDKRDAVDTSESAGFSWGASAAEKAEPLALPHGAMTRWRTASSVARQYEIQRPFPDRLQRCDFFLVFETTSHAAAVIFFSRQDLFPRGLDPCCSAGSRCSEVHLSMSYYPATLTP